MTKFTKRILLILAVTMLVFSGCSASKDFFEGEEVSAENVMIEDVSVDEQGFSFRDVAWGTTLEEARDFESQKEDSIFLRATEGMYFFNSNIYGYDCELIYGILDGEIIDTIYLRYESLSRDEISTSHMNNNIVNMLCFLTVYFFMCFFIKICLE